MSSADGPCRGRRHGAVSRRTCLPLIAATALSPLLVPASARAQSPAWQIYRREDLGFEVEMPGKPTVETEASGEPGNQLIRAVNALVTFEDIRYIAGFWDYGGPFSVQQDADAQREAVRLAEGRIVRESIVTTSDGGILELAMESPRVHAIMRAFVVKNHRFMASVDGGREVHSSAMVEHFLRSLRLLPAAR